MSPKLKNTGTCALCGLSATSSAMIGHAAACVATHDAAGAPEALVVLRVAAVCEWRYWLLLEAKATAPLRHVDTLLRQLWLECCGHMSAFRVGRSQVALTRAVASAFPGAGVTLDYEYDFGSTTALTVERIGERRGALGRAAVRVLARNDAIVWTCANCASPASVLCPFCFDSDAVLFCDIHADLHE